MLRIDSLQYQFYLCNSLVYGDLSTYIRINTRFYIVTLIIVIYSTTLLTTSLELFSQEGGSNDPKYNFLLARIITEAKSLDIPKSTIENAIKGSVGNFLISLEIDS